MRPRSVILLVLTVLLVAFAGLNWDNLLTATPISFLFGSIEAPLGIVLLLVVAFMTLLFFGFLAFLEAQARSERKSLQQEIDRWRELADKAEASRIEELKGIIEAGFDDLYDRIQSPGSAPSRRPEASPTAEDAGGPEEIPDDAVEPAGNDAERIGAAGETTETEGSAP